MKKIPTYWEVQSKYLELHSKGKDAWSLSPLERIILGAPKFSKLQELLFRRRLSMVLKESLITPETNLKFDKFTERYPRTGNGKDLLAILLCDAIIEFRRANGYPTRIYI